MKDTNEDRFGRELKIKGILTLFHGRIDSLPLTKGLVYAHL
jgi:hypothetical protein